MQIEVKRLFIGIIEKKNTQRGSTPGIILLFSPASSRKYNIIIFRLVTNQLLSNVFSFFFSPSLSKISLYNTHFVTVLRNRFLLSNARRLQQRRKHTYITASRSLCLFLSVTIQKKIIIFFPTTTTVRLY